MPINKEAFKRGRLAVRPGKMLPDKEALEKLFLPGVHALNIDREREDIIYVPSGYSKNHPAPLGVMLHCAGGDAERGLSLLRWTADANNCISACPGFALWQLDIISTGHFGPDIAFINHALEMYLPVLQ